MAIDPRNYIIRPRMTKFGTPPSQGEGPGVPKIYPHSLKPAKFDIDFYTQLHSFHRNSSTIAGYRAG